jgi:hypothetical protein
MSIKDKLAKLDIKNKQLLMVAFESGITQLIKLEGGTFIGVNIIPNDNIIIDEVCNKWSIGRIKDV